ncbi:antibiotic biosynthesis monooxygenase [Agromyces bracchium]|uniref:antibiotic biosynthesis monooxygenase family protein n=1 Tax=Agromyces bracchium TaxID=88376 RepID=UPI0031D7A9E8
MILEHAILPVVPGREAAFEAAFAEARPIISSMPGFVDLTLSRSVETPNEYLLLVHWERLADHDPGFRGSPGYARWRELLHGFYEPFPVVEHFREVASIGLSSGSAGARATAPADPDDNRPASATAASR